MSKEIIEAVRMIELEKGIDAEQLLVALEEAIYAAYKKTPEAVPFAKVEIDRSEGTFRIHQFVGDELPDDAIILLEIDEVEEVVEVVTVDPATGLAPEEEEDDLGFEIDWTKVPVEAIETVDVDLQHSFGRIAAQTAKQVIMQRIREAERGMMYDEYIDRVGDLITGVVQAAERGVTIVELGRNSEAILPFSEGIPGERFDHGARVKAVILEVRDSPRGPQIVLSRGSDELIKRLFELEVPEIADGLVEIKNVARDPGFRSKIAVDSNTPGVDPVGACVGPRGSRVRMVVSELRGEKIDIIPWNPEPARFIAKALSPARVREVLVDDDARQATVIVPDDQLALAIGREGQNARLAARLTGWRIDIRSATEMAEEFDGEESGGSEVEEGGRSRAWQVRRQQRLAVDEGEEGAEGEATDVVAEDSSAVEPTASEDTAEADATAEQAASAAAAVEGDAS